MEKENMFVSKLFFTREGQEKIIEIDYFNLNLVDVVENIDYLLQTGWKLRDNTDYKIYTDLISYNRGWELWCIKYLAPTGMKGARVKLTNLDTGKSKTIDYDYFHSTTGCAVKWFLQNGYLIKNYMYTDRGIYIQTKAL